MQEKVFLSLGFPDSPNTRFTGSLDNQLWHLLTEIRFPFGLFFFKTRRNSRCPPPETAFAGLKGHFKTSLISEMSRKVLTLTGLLLDVKGKMDFAHIEPNSAGQFSLGSDAAR